MTKLEISVDDGDVLDRKSMKLLDKYGLKATFFVPVDSWGFENPHEYRGHKIGGHTIHHPSDLKTLGSAQKQEEIIAGREILGSRFGTDIVEFCYPRGRFDPECVDMVKRAGYLSARTTIVLKTAYDDPFRKPTTVHVYPRKEYNSRNWMSVALEILTTKPAYFHLWWHSWEVERLKEWKNLETVLNVISKVA